MKGEKIVIIEADLSNGTHQDGIVRTVDAYARDEMGGGSPLNSEVRAALIEGLKNHPSKMILLALLEGEIVGAAVCFFGFSTFAAKRSVNIHDLSVLPEYRDSGVGRKLIEAVFQKGRELDCCKVTLEVRRDNERARHLYRSCGFSDWAIAPLEFWEKKL